VLLRRQPRPASPLEAQVRRLPDDARVLQLQPADPAETVALAAGCRGSARRIVVVWPDTNEAFETWHRAVIAAGALPYVEPRRDADPAAPGFALVHGAR
jgi:hypothetical protein